MGDQAKRIEFEIRNLSERGIGKIQLRLLQALASATPVDTGFARSGWTPAVGTPITKRLDPPSDKEEAREVANKRSQANVAKSVALGRAYKLTDGPVYISNAVPYIEALNRGSSAQAGAKFVERAIEVVVRSFGGRPI